MKKILVLMACLLITGGPSLAETFPDTALKPIEESIAIQKQTQVRQDQWDTEQKELAARHEELTFESESLEAEKEALAARLADLTQSVESLEQEKEEITRMASQLEPSLQSALDQLHALVDEGLPFSMVERQARLDAVDKAMADPSIPTSVKFRQVFRTLLVEAQHGSSTEVTREMISLGGRDIMANVLRLGRLSLFFQTLDQSATGNFDPVTQSWVQGPQTFDQGIAHAVDIAAKRRPADIVLLPLGKVVAP